MERIKLTDICSPKQWKTIPTGELLSEGYPVYGANGVIGYYNEYNHEEPVVAITCRGATCGSINVTVPKSYVTGNAMCLDDVREDIERDYLYYFLVHYNGKRIISGSAQPQITRQNLEKVEICIYPRKKQIEIVNLLKRVESIIESRREEISALDNLIKARFVEMFGDPVSTTNEQKAALEEICEKITDGEHGSVTRISEGHPFLNAKHILKNGQIDWNTITFIGDDDHKRIYKRCNPEEGDILLTTTGTIGNVAIMPVYEEVSMDRGITLLKIDHKKVTSEFAAELLKQPSVQAEMGVNVHASAIGHLFMNKVKKLPAIIPSMDKQIEFTDFVKQVDKSKVAVQKALDETQKLFNSLMQEYFG